MDTWVRTRWLLGDEAMERLQAARVAVFGIGGVGGYVAEALARSGIGAIDLIDHDTVAESNLNRQLIATRQTIGRQKAEVMKERILSINPEAQVRVWPVFYLPENADDFPIADYDYVVDAVDTVTAKIALAVACRDAGTPLISSMGTGNKLNPAMLEVADLYETRVCPLAKVMRKELKARGIRKLKVVYSKEKPLRPQLQGNDNENEGKEGGRRKDTPGSTAFVPGTAGLIIASEVVKDLTGVQGGPSGA